MNTTDKTKDMYTDIMFAATAVGINPYSVLDSGDLYCPDAFSENESALWNPLKYDQDAFRLALALHEKGWSFAELDKLPIGITDTCTDAAAEFRKAIFDAAVRIGMEMADANLPIRS